MPPVQSCLHCQFLSHVLKALFFNQNSPKIKLFLLKNAKFLSAGGSIPRPLCLRRLGALPPNPQAPAAGGFAPRPPLAIFPKTAPPLRISGYAPVMYYLYVLLLSLARLLC